MWIFGYGSLMYDGWEQSRHCIRRERATLLDHERSFTKASVRNWGSAAHPAPTLRVVPRAGATCVGVAFQFSADHAPAVLEYLASREGKGFHRRDVSLELLAGERVVGECYFYEGTNTLDDVDLEKIADLALGAKGKDGTGVEYLVDLKTELDRHAIEDQRVDELLSIVRLKMKR